MRVGDEEGRVRAEVRSSVMGIQYTLILKF